MSTNVIRYMYIRDSKRNPIGCLSIKIDRNKNRLQYGLSMRNPVDAVDRNGKSVRFDRVLAQKLAADNLLTRAKSLFISADANMHDATTAIMRDLLAHKSAPSGSLKFAQRWLKINTIRTVQAPKRYPDFRGAPY